MLNEFFPKTHMLYCVQQVREGWYVFLNRNYKPVGQISQDWVDYKDYAIPLSITPRRATRASYLGSDNTKVIYLARSTYDFCSVDYFQRLQEVLRWKLNGNAITPEEEARLKEYVPRPRVVTRHQGGRRG